jgi:hypothetical protein
MVNIFSTIFNNYFFSLMPLFMTSLVTFLDPVSIMVSDFNLYNDVKSNEIEMFNIMNKALGWNNKETKEAYVDGQ